MEWNGMKCSGVEWNGMDGIGMESIERNRKECNKRTENLYIYTQLQQ
jgi:hypothetical protein